jgi:PAS domain S-box-containing protein
VERKALSPDEIYARWRQEPLRLFDESPVAITVFDDELRYLDGNPAACRLLQITREELSTKRVGEISRDSQFARQVRASRGEVFEESLQLPMTDGSVRFVTAVTRPNITPGLHLCFFMDVTEQQKLQNEVEHQSRLEAIGKVASGVAHDFNNMLTAILSYADLQLQRAEASETIRRYALGIQAAAERASETTQQLLAFCRRQALQFHPVDVNEVLRESARLVQRLLPEDIRLELNLEADLPAVFADPGQLNQVFVNLAVNARDAMPTGGRLLFASSKSCRKQAVDPQITLLIHDTGVGISAEVLPHIFDPFFTTKPRGKGTGLGLATVYRIVKQTRGEILVHTAPGRGTTFEITLPVAQRDAIPEITDLCLKPTTTVRASTARLGDK